MGQQSCLSWACLSLKMFHVLSESGLQVIAEITGGHDQVVLGGAVLSKEGHEAIISDVDELKCKIG